MLPRAVLVERPTEYEELLARREEQLVARTGANERLRATEQAAAERIEAEAADERARLTARRTADEIDLVEGARLRAERERAEIESAVPPEVLLALALKELAGRLPDVEHLSLTPDLLTPLIARAANGRE